MARLWITSAEVPRGACGRRQTTVDNHRGRELGRERVPCARASIPTRGGGMTVPPQGWLPPGTPPPPTRPPSHGYPAPMPGPWVPPPTGYGPPAWVPRPPVAKRIPENLPFVVYPSLAKRSLQLGGLVLFLLLIGVCVVLMSFASRTSDHTVQIATIFPML